MRSGALLLVLIAILFSIGLSGKAHSQTWVERRLNELTARVDALTDVTDCLLSDPKLEKPAVMRLRQRLIQANQTENP